MTPREVVKRAIRFEGPEWVPVYMFNRDPLDGDILSYGLCLGEGERNEWGYAFSNLDDGTMGQVKQAVLPRWEDLDSFEAPPIDAERRLAGLEELRKTAGGRYILGGLGITGFNLYTFLRGFENAMIDFVAEPERSAQLLGCIMQFETDLIGLSAEAGLDGVHFADDWGSQENLFIAPGLWRELFKPRYEKQFAYAHELGLDVWFHSCGRIGAIAPDLHEIGVDVLNVSQPNANDIEALGRALRGRQCFMAPVSYQTVSISGSPEEIVHEARRLFEALGAPAGGFIGYVEEYTCMGMSEANYQACVKAFRKLNAQ